ncbi:peptidoglycan DD-metalloendopeptidase family protein [Nocardioides sp.]|uniref:M23 family metallopeptidase n=1 Tax=Nocardioides sp. TaxID=35761 RepID=UPI003D0B518F
MNKTLLAGGAALATVMLGPAAVLLGLAALINPAQAACVPTTSTAASTTSGSPAGADAPAETSRVVFPLPAGTWVRTSGYGMRVHPITGERKLHTGVDFAAPAGTPILAAADGRVAFAGPATGYGHLILVEHTVEGQLVATGYAHMYADGIGVSVGDRVHAGDHIADVGSDGYSTGAHLHFEVRPGGARAATVNPEPWLAGHGAAEVDQNNSTTVIPAGCEADVVAPEEFDGSNPDALVDDPTSNGKITARTAYVLSQVRARFPESSWACWSPRPGTKSEHPLGRACDGTFGNSIGQAAKGHALEYGWEVTNWLKANATKLGVEYLIWQGKIWSVARSSEGWRSYNGGGMHDPSGITGGHYDHLHFTIATGVRA